MNGNAIAHRRAATIASTTTEWLVPFRLSLVRVLARSLQYLYSVLANPATLYVRLQVLVQTKWTENLSPSLAKEQLIWIQLARSLKKSFLCLPLIYIPLLNFSYSSEARPFQNLTSNLSRLSCVRIWTSFVWELTSTAVWKCMWVSRDFYVFFLSEQDKKGI